MKFSNSCDGCYSDSLDVRFTKACDNNCPFCIERAGLCAQKENVDAMIKSTIESGRKTILILGGEPFLRMENLQLYVKGIRSHVNNIYITTSLPRSIKDEWQKFCEIMNLIDGLNVSLQHYKNLINNDVLKATSHHNRIILLQQICESEEFTEKVRVSINLVKGYIDNKYELENFLNVMTAINVKHVKINELQHSSDLYVSFEKIMRMKLPSPYTHGCQKDIDIMGGKMRVTLKRACFCVEQSLDANMQDLVKAMIKRFNKKYRPNQLVLYESGQISKGWMKEKEEGDV